MNKVLSEAVAAGERDAREKIGERAFAVIALGMQTEEDAIRALSLRIADSIIEHAKTVGEATPIAVAAALCISARAALCFPYERLRQPVDVALVDEVLRQLCADPHHSETV